MACQEDQGTIDQYLTAKDKKVEDRKRKEAMHCEEEERMITMPKVKGRSQYKFLQASWTG